jgi:hypothetical protein
MSEQDRGGAGVLFPFVWAASSALSIPQAINDIPNIPTLAGWALQQAAQGNWGNAFEAGIDALGALDMLDGLLEVAKASGRIRPGGPQPANKTANPPNWPVKDLDRNDPRVVLQSEPHACAAASTEMVARAHGVEDIVNQPSILADVRESMKDPLLGDTKGITADELTDAANSLEQRAGFPANDGKSWVCDGRLLDNLQDEVDRISADGPWTADIKYTAPSGRDTWHQVTVLGLDAAGDIEILDPAGYSYKMTLADFENWWYDTYITRR